MLVYGGTDSWRSRRMLTTGFITRSELGPPRVHASHGAGSMESTWESRESIADGGKRCHHGIFSRARSRSCCRA